MKRKIAICWFRRDLRLYDNTALYHALRANEQVLPLFIFDRHILDKLEDKADRRVSFIHDRVLKMQQALIEKESSIAVYYGFPEEIFQTLSTEFDITHVYTNHDYEPYAIERDKLVASILREKGIPFSTFKDQVIFEKDEIRKPDNTPYTVFTPYSKKWRSALSSSQLEGYPVDKFAMHFCRQSPIVIPSLQSMGFIYSAANIPYEEAENSLISDYSSKRDFPASDGTSRMSVHLRFGTISIRQLASKARTLNPAYLNELVWREFYQMILWNFPAVAGGKAFKPAYDRIQWRNNEAEFADWCAGKTGYPLVDAGMRELNNTGFMHNRVRMVTASFLSKHLLIDWRWGEAYFAAKLLDYDLAANNGGWQWASGSGCDAVPYFRIFNPTLQAKKFDPQSLYIRKWVTEFNSPDYPLPIVEHEFARERCLQIYNKAIKIPAF